jgi:hypothetical protein
MCGICGMFNGDSQSINKDGVLEMFAETASRGRDAAGYAASVEQKMWYYKQPISSDTMVDSKPPNDWHMDGQSWIGHCRLGTHGPASNPKNNHPFLAQGYALIHNGIISNWYEYDDECAGECDSEVILRRILKHKNAGLPVSKAIQMACAELEGDMACALTNQEGHMWLWRREGGEFSNSWTPLSVAWTPDRPLLYFASTHKALEHSLSGDSWLTASVERQQGFHIYTGEDSRFKVSRFSTPDEPVRQYSSKNSWSGGGRVLEKKGDGTYKYVGGGQSTSYKKSDGESAGTDFSDDDERACYCDFASCAECGYFTQYEKDEQEGEETTSETVEEWVKNLHRQADDDTTYFPDEGRELLYLLSNGDMIDQQTGEKWSDPQAGSMVYVCDECTEWCLFEDLRVHRDAYEHALFKRMTMEEALA